MWGFARTVNMSGVVEPPAGAKVFYTGVTGIVVGQGMWGTDPLKSKFSCNKVKALVPKLLVPEAERNGARRRLRA
jgi:hypothetical protein